MTTSERERGAVAVLVAVCLVGFIGVAGLIIDGSRAYSLRRQMQNAADAGALAGANAFNQYLRDPYVDPSTVNAAAIATAMENQAGSAVCRWVNESGAPLGPCSNTKLAGGASTSGVIVEVSADQGSSFAQVIGVESLTARATATAQVLAVREFDGQASPFLACGTQSTSVNDSTPNEPVHLLIPSAAGAGNLILNPAAIGHRYMVHTQFADILDACGETSGWKGWVDQDGTYPLPGTWETVTGDRAGPARSIVAGVPGCTGTELTNCYVALPVCVEIEGNGASVQGYCLTLGLFRLYDVGSGGSGNAHDAEFMGPVTLTEGNGSGRPVGYEARVVKLTA